MNETAHAVRYRVCTAARWTLMAVLVGVACGAAAMAISAIALASEQVHRMAPWTLFLLVPLGILGAWLYKKLRVPFETSTVTVINATHHGKFVSWRIAPAIAAGMAATLIGGGSAGKEGAALQAGAGVASLLSHLHLVGDDTHSVRALGLCGMAAAFSALMFAPISAMAFVVESARLHLSDLRDSHLLAVPLAALVGYAVASPLGVGRMWVVRPDAPASLWSTNPAILVSTFGQIALVAVACTLGGLAFVAALKFVRMRAARLLPSPYLRVTVGAVLAVLLVALVPGANAASGTGARLVIAALDGQGVGMGDFAWKLVLTVLCLAFGLKGGEILPTLCIGACLGWSMGSLLEGLPLGGAYAAIAPAFMAAVGMVAALSACTGCTFASFLLGVEAFGPAGIIAFALAALIGAISGRRLSIYVPVSWEFGGHRRS